MNILFLYSEVLGYTQATITELVGAGYRVFVVHDDISRVSQYKIRRQKGVKFYPRSKMNFVSIQDLILKTQPELIVVSGWMDYTYLRVARLSIKKKYNVVCAMDTQWTGSMKQMFACAIGRSGLLNIFFSHAWICYGQSHYEFARRIGFKENKIIKDFYSADTSIFNKSYEVKMEQKKNGGHFPKVFLFLGRIEKIKGFDLLLKAWEIASKTNDNWKLKIIGSGSLETSIPKLDNVIHINFIQPDALLNEMVNAGVLIMPSLKEPWGVVVHECVSAGMPLIVTDQVGAANCFLLDGYNGCKIRSNDLDNFVDVMIKIMGYTDDMLYKMSERSYQLSSRITPRTSASNLLSIV